MDSPSKNCCFCHVQHPDEWLYALKCANMNIGNQPLRQLQVDSVQLVNIAREVTPQPDEASSGRVVMLAASVQVL